MAGPFLTHRTAAVSPQARKTNFFMKKLGSTILFIGIAVVLPLLGRPHLLADWRTITVMFCIALLL